MIIINDPQIPDRTAYILDHTHTDPRPEMVKVAQHLEASGADFIAIPCNTAHYFYEAVTQAVEIPVLNIMTETATTLSKTLPAGASVGLMATEGTVASGIFQECLQRVGFSTILPSEADQERLGELIYDGVKAGNPYDPTEMKDIAQRLMERGCKAVVVGCTELSVVTGELDERPVWLIDALEVLAQCCVDWYRAAQATGKP